MFKWSHHPKPENFWPIERHEYQRWLNNQGVDWNDAYGVKTDDDWDSELFLASKIEARYHQTTWCAKEGIAFISQQGRKPWLLSINFFDPHPPFDPPPEYLQAMDVEKMPLPLFQPEEMDFQFEFLQRIDHSINRVYLPENYDARLMVAAYYAQIELIDEQVGRILEALKATNQWKDTIIIFMSDHGEMLGDHGLVLKGCRFYEGLVHVPLIISWPGHFQEDLRSKALVELVDIVPTLLETIGLPTPEFVEGISFLPILTGEKDPQKHHLFVRCEYHDALDKPHHSHANMIFDGRYKLVVYHGHKLGELYDLHEDSHEFHNLWDSADKAALKHDLIKRCFDAAMLNSDPGPQRVGRY